MQYPIKRMQNVCKAPPTGMGPGNVPCGIHKYARSTFFLKMLFPIKDLKLNIKFWFNSWGCERGWGVGLNSIIFQNSFEVPLLHNQRFSNFEHCDFIFSTFVSNSTRSLLSAKVLFKIRVYQEILIYNNIRMRMWWFFKWRTAPITRSQARLVR